MDITAPLVDRRFRLIDRRLRALEVVAIGRGRARFLEPPLQLVGARIGIRL